MTRAIKIRIMPSAIDNSISPLDVSRDMAVVITLVNPLILPPTIRAMPTSEIARPNPIITAAITARSGYFGSQWGR